MKAIILAAGMGKRLQKYLNNAPKCLMPIGNETLLAREIRFLKELGFQEKDIFVVGGYKYEMLNDCGASLVVNLQYENTDNAYSLGIALQAIGSEEDVLVMDADLLFDKEILQTAIESTHSNLILTKKSKDLEESTGIVLRDNGTVEAIGKQYHNSGYVYISIFKFGKELIPEFIEELLKTESSKTWYTLALTKLMGKYPFFNLPVYGKWHEIDFPEDYIEAKKLFRIRG